MPPHSHQIGSKNSGGESTKHRTRSHKACVNLEMFSERHTTQHTTSLTWRYSVAVNPDVKIDAYVLVICRSHHKKQAACMTIALSLILLQATRAPWQGTPFSPQTAPLGFLSTLLECTSGPYKPLQLLAKFCVHFGGSEPQGTGGLSWPRVWRRILLNDLHLPLSLYLYIIPPFIFCFQVILSRCISKHRTPCQG